MSSPEAREALSPGLARRLLALVAAMLVATVGVFALGARADAAPIDGAITNLTITNRDGTPVTGPVTPYQALRLNGTWSVPDNSPAGSTFTLTYPDTLTYDGGSLTTPLKNAAGDIIATATVDLSTHTVTFTLDDYVTQHPRGITGGFTMEAGTNGNIDYTLGDPVELEFTGSVTPNPSVITIEVAPRTERPNDGKATWFTAGYHGVGSEMQSVVALSKGHSGEVTIVDHPGQAMILTCDRAPEVFAAATLQDDGDIPHTQALVEGVDYTYTCDTASNTATYVIAQADPDLYYDVSFFSTTNVPVANLNSGRYQNDATITENGVPTDVTGVATVTGIGGQADANDHKVAVGDCVWLDTNRNGRQDAGEAGIPGVTLTLTGPDGKPVFDIFGKPMNPVTTDADGKYSFPNLPPLPAGEHYTVTVTAPEGYQPT